MIGVARFLQQRQDFEDATARSYQVEIARPQPASPQASGPAAAPRGDRRPAGAAREALRDEIDGETRDTALLVGAGLIAGLTGAALLFSGLIASMRRPLEELVERLRAARRRRPRAPGSRSAASRRPRRSAPPSTRWPTSCSGEAGERDQLDRMKDEFVLTASHELRSPLTSVQGFAELLMLEREQADAQAGRDGRDHPRQHAATWSACSTTCSTSPAATPAG